MRRSFLFDLMGGEEPRVRLGCADLARETGGKACDQLIDRPVGDEVALADGPVGGREPRHPLERPGAPERDRVRAAVGQCRCSWCSTRCSRTTSPSTSCGSGDRRSVEASAASRAQVAVLGVGMHPWGKWGRNFVEYGMVAAAGRPRRRRARRGATSSSSPAPTPSATATPASSPAPRSRRRSAGRARASRRATRRARRARTRSTPRARRSSPGCCDVALVVGADTTPKGFFAPVGGERADDPDWLRFRLLGATNPTYFALYARRRMDAVRRDERRLRPGEGQERPARARQPERAVPQGDHGRRRARAARSSPIRSGSLDICATSDGGAAIVAVEHGLRARSAAAPTPVRGRGGLDRHARATRNTVLELPDFATDSSAAVAAPPDRAFRDSIAGAAVRGGRASVPTTSSLAEVYDLSTALELDWYENIGLCGEGEAEALLRSGDTTIGGRIPVNPSGGLGVLRRGDPGAGDRPGVRGRRGSCAARPSGRQVEGATRRHHRQPGPVRSRLVRDRQHVEQTRRTDGRGLHRRRSPHAGRAARRRALAGPPGRPRRALDQRRSSSAPASTRARSTTSSSATSTASARRPATSPAPAGWWPASPSTCPAPPSTGSAARRSRPSTSPRRA